MKNNNEALAGRVLEIDALRGFALMGLFIVHMVEYFELYWYAPEPGWVHSTVFGIFGGKAYGIFALLFGYGFYVVMERNRQRGLEFRARFAWRMVLLWGFGYLHSLLYAGDVLQVLALAGMVLLLLEKLPSWLLAGLGLLLVLQLPHFGYLAWATLPAQANLAQPFFWNLMANNFEVFAQGSFAELIAYNGTTAQLHKWVFTLESGRLANVIGMVLWGYLFARADITGWLRQNPVRAAKVLSALVVLALIFFAIRSLPNPSLSTGLAQWIVTEVQTLWFNAAVTLVMVLAFVLAFQHTAARSLFNTLASSGHMSLTVYMLQAVVFVPCFYGFGLGWYQDIGQPASLLLALLTWPMIAWAAHWWMKRHYYGPCEWLWRAATYGTTSLPWRRPDF